MKDDDVNRAVTYGLFAARALHDAEEVAPPRAGSVARLPEPRERFPTVPELVCRAAESVHRREFGVAVGVMGTLVGAAAVAGARTGGGSGFCQGALTPRRAGVPRPTRARDAGAGAALTAGATILSHTVARGLTGAR
ncbi:HXXEE domain-containing protein [Streptomyces sp. TRM49041]|uniref:HXXEE domain-containing protein n=1 Tax=Streptomyces sp. TRM49041 TaxID=2603216 RepID=UPI0011ED1622|nr:HXXEE domain-containing protein [Streptomyces sp. TRM49041]